MPIGNRTRAFTLYPSAQHPAQVGPGDTLEKVIAVLTQLKRMAPTDKSGSSTAVAVELNIKIDATETLSEEMWQSLKAKRLAEDMAQIHANITGESKLTSAEAAQLIKLALTQYESDTL